MKTLQSNGQLSADAPDKRDGLVKPSNKPRAAWYVQFDGIHIFYDKGDGQTVVHVHKPISDILAQIEGCDSSLGMPKIVANKKK